eukprot:scaffold17221_cov26-Cyclotella_meneghiniana.AAC.1
MSNSIDDEFNAFLKEVDALSIQHGDSSVTDNDVHSSNSNTAAVISADVKDSSAAPIPACESTITPNDSISTNKQTKKVLRKEKELVIKNAGNNQRAWADFKKMDMSTRDSETINDITSRPKISFKIQSGKSKTKKKSKVMLSDELTNNGIDTNQNTQYNKSSSSHASWQSICPYWTLVIDTSALVNDHGREAQRIFDLANHVSLTRFKNQKQQGRCPSANTIDEPIRIIIPYKVWNELEYQSKSDNSDLAFSARSVMRMLKDELQQNNNQSSISEGIGPDVVIQSQSLSQSKDAAKKFVSHDLVTAPTNDDHIIACALVELEKWSGVNIAGGVVMITSDNNMACKAYSN